LTFGLPIFDWDLPQNGATPAFNRDSAVEGTAKSKAQAFRSERNGPVSLNKVASSGAMSGVLKRCEPSAE